MKAKKRSESAPKPGVSVGDHVYFRHDDGPSHGRVLACGKHGVTVRHKGERCPVRWGDVLGHRRRAKPSYRVVDRGEDGAIAEDDKGKRVYLAGDLPDDDDDGEEKQKLQKAAPLLKAVKNRPGLSLQETTDKQGRTVKRWKRTGEKAKKEREPGKEKRKDFGSHNVAAGDHVGFRHEGEQHRGHVVAAGADGATVKHADTGEHHRVFWHEIATHEPKKNHKEAEVDDKKEVHEKDITNPIDPSLSEEQKLARIKELTAENVPIVDKFLNDLDAELGTKSGSNVKTDESILAKANRPIIKAVKPWHDIEHIRDTFRFKTVINDVASLETIAKKLGDLGASVVKVDMKKLLEPKEWGWRIVAFDLRMPNGQLVEYYLPLKELEAAKKSTGHKLFEDGRGIDPRNASSEELEKLAALQKESRELYDKAYRQYQSRSGADDKADLASLARAAAAAGSLTKDQPSSRSPTLKAGAFSHLPLLFMAPKLSSELKTKTPSPPCSSS